MSSKETIRLDVILLSKYGRSDGGRETWAYNFLPALVARHKHLNIRVFGFLPTGDADPSDEFTSSLSCEDRKRLRLRLFPIKKNRVPIFFQMCWAMWRDSDRRGQQPDFSIAVGGMYERLMMAAKGYKKSCRIVWLRTILFNEKADRFPRAILPFLRRLDIALLRNCNRLLANGDDIASYYGEHGLHVDVIKNGVDVARWNSGELASAVPLHVAYIGRLSMVKGIAEFLDAVQLVKEGDRAGEFVFHVIGDGSLKCKERVQSLARQGLLKSYGAVDYRDLPDLVAGMHACVALTWARENVGGGGTSNALMEQMAAGKTILAWDNVIFRRFGRAHV